MSKCHYLKLPNCEKVPIFTNNRCEPLEKPIFCKRFLKLWELLFNVGIANGPTFAGIVDSFPRPNSLSSNLIGVPFLTDPSSVVRLFSFTNANLDGPIINSGYNLEPYNDSVCYEIKWNVRSSLDNFIIGFYRSDGFSEDATNTFALICGNLGASIFNSTKGSFICFGISNLFVATNQDTIIDMEVRVIIPDKIVYPEITLERSYKKFITVKDSNYNKHKVLVYTIFQTDNTGFTVTKQPSKYFIEATRVIQDFLVATGLSVTLMRPTNPVPTNLLSACNDCVSTAGCTDIITREYLNFFTPGGNVSMNTINTCNPQYYLVVGIYQGIRLDPPPNKVSRITYEITSFENNIQFAAYTVKVAIEYRSGLLWYTHNKLDAVGNIDGDAEQIETRESTGNLVSFTGSFRISETAKAFGMTIYYDVTDTDQNQDFDLSFALVRNTIIRKVAISYEDRVI